MSSIKRDAETLRDIIRHRLIVEPYHPESEYGTTIKEVTLWFVTTPERQKQCLESLSWLKESLQDAVREALQELEEEAERA